MTLSSCSSPDHLCELWGCCRWHVWLPPCFSSFWTAVLGFLALWLLCCSLLDPTLHPLLPTSQHSLNDTVSSPTNHSNCCSSAPQFSRKPASSNQHLSSEEVWKPTGQPGWPRHHQWGTWMFASLTHSLCFASVSSEAYSELLLWKIENAL